MERNEDVSSWSCGRVDHLGTRSDAVWRLLLDECVLDVADVANAVLNHAGDTAGTIAGRVDPGTTRSGDPAGIERFQDPGVGPGRHWDGLPRRVDEGHPIQPDRRKGTGCSSGPGAGYSRQGQSLRHTRDQGSRWGEQHVPSLRVPTTSLVSERSRGTNDALDRCA